MRHLRAFAQVLALVLVCISAAPRLRAVDNGLAATPPMGWNSWNLYACGPDFNEVNVRAQADAMVALGLDAAGYEYINLDGCWQPELGYDGDTGRDSNGNILADPVRFPSGIAALADYVHSKGLKLGIYTDIGHVGCKNRPGSAGHEVQDVKQYAAWGVDYVKVDWCESLTRSGMQAARLYKIWTDALAAHAPHMVFSICNWGEQAPWNWGPDTGHLWRNTIDIWDEWEYDGNNRLSVTTIIDLNSFHAARARPGAWNDPDMLVVGLRGTGGVQGRGMSTDQYRAHFGMWAIMAAPLLLGNDLTTMDAATLEILSNPEVIAVNQDTLGIQAPLVQDFGNGIQIYAKPLSGRAARAVAVLNRTSSDATVAVNWADIGLAANDASVRDLWARQDLGAHVGSVSVSVPSQGMALLKVVGSEPTIPIGTTYLSDNTPTLAQVGWGPLEKDLSVGDRRSFDGRTLTLNGTPFFKGLGVHASSRVEYHLGRNCSSFSASVGVDDEVGSRGSVVFEVWADATRVYRSPEMTGDSATEQINASVAGADTLRLLVHEGSSMDTAENAYDHADWADAQVVCGAASSRAARFVSDMSYSVMQNGWGPAEADRSNGERAQGDGNPLSIGGEHYPKGLGAHAASRITLSLSGLRCTEFLAHVGVDDEVGSNGSVHFYVKDGNEQVLWDSGVRYGWQAAMPAHVNIADVDTLHLDVSDAGDGAAYDHANWGNAHVVCGDAGEGDGGGIGRGSDGGGGSNDGGDEDGGREAAHVDWVSLVNASLRSPTVLKAHCDECGAGATSSQVLAAGAAGKVQFAAGDGSHRFIGLSDGDAIEPWDFDFALQAWGATLTVYQDGVWVAAVSFVSSDIVAIEVSGAGEVAFTKNGQTITPIIPLKPAPGGLRVKAALIDSWGTLEDVHTDF